MQEIVWVYGASAAGKETFIQNIMSNSEYTKAITSSLHWQNRHISVCKESLLWVAQFPGDTIAEQERPKLISIIPKLAKRCDVLLIKGQDFDLSIDTPMVIKQLLPKATHRIVFVDVGLDEIYKRVIHKPWWNKATKRAEVEGWLEEQIDRLIDMRDAFTFTTISGESGKQYKQERFPGNFI